MLRLTGSSANDVWAIDVNGDVAQFCGSSWQARGAVPGTADTLFVAPGRRWAAGNSTIYLAH